MAGDLKLYLSLLPPVSAGILDIFRLLCPPKGWQKRKTGKANGPHIPNKKFWQACNRGFFLIQVESKRHSENPKKIFSYEGLNCILKSS